MELTAETLIMLVGFVGTLIAIASPVIKLTKTMAELTLTVQGLKDSLNDIILKNHDAHKQMWEHNRRQDDVINDHDRRLTKIESKFGIDFDAIHYGALHTDERMFDET